MRLAGSDCAPAWVASRIGGHAKNSVSGSDHRRSHRMAPHVLQNNNFEPAQRDQMSRSITDPATTTSSPANDDAAAALMATGRHVDGSAITVIPTYTSPIHLRTPLCTNASGSQPARLPEGEVATASADWNPFLRTATTIEQSGIQGSISHRSRRWVLHADRRVAARC